MKTLLFFILISLISGQTIDRENRLFWDGGNWKRIDKLAENEVQAYRIKAAYLNGVLDGRLYFYLKSWSQQQSFSDSLYGDRIDYLTPREMIPNIDRFYTEPTNTYVPVISAIFIANMFGEQVSQVIIDNFIVETKFWINRLILDMEEEGMFNLLKDKQEKHSFRNK